MITPPTRLLRRACGLLLALAASGAACAGELLALPSRPGVTESVYVDAPAAAPAWVVVLFAGDDGALALGDAGANGLRGNFLVRTASYWTEHGDAPVLFDAPSDHANGMDDPFRLGADGAQDVAAAVTALRARYPGAKVALVGTSRGTITVGNVLARMPALADAYVLTSPVTIGRGSQSGLSGMSWPGVRARVLVVSNEGDGCSVSPFDVAKRMAGANGFGFIAVSSDARVGTGRRVECNGNSPHGYLGIEPQVLDAIRNWLG